MMGVIGFVVTLSILVLIHEWGHYAVARLCGVRVLAFSLGFGKVLFSRTDKNGCEWRLSAVPFGGYVKMLNTAEKDEPLEKAVTNPVVYTEEDYAKGAFDKKNVWQRFAVVIAGPAMNIILAVVIYAAVAMVGTYEPSTRLGEPPAGTPAAVAGVERDWSITNVAGSSVRTFNDMRMELVAHFGENPVTVDFATPNGSNQALDFDMRKIRGDTMEDPAALLGFRAFMNTIRVFDVISDTPADKAGLKKGETIIAAAGKKLTDATDLINLLRDSIEKDVTLTVADELGNERDVIIRPAAKTLEDGKVVGQIGVRLGGTPELVLTRVGPVDAVVIGVEKSVNFIRMTLRSLAHMVTGDVSMKAVSGPIAIGDMAGQSMQVGALAYVLFLAMISLSLGVINLLPVPMLDGGHLMFYSWEILSGRQPSEKVMEIGQKFGLGFVLLLMVLGMSNDLMRLMS